MQNCEKAGIKNWHYFADFCGLELDFQLKPLSTLPGTN